MSGGKPEYLSSENLDNLIHYLEETIKLSLRFGLNIHSAVGSKYGELWVARELLPHEPLLASWRGMAKGVEKPNSADIVLARTGVKIEVKWGMYHHDAVKDRFARAVGGIPVWGWQFGQKQVKERKFDYAVLIAAEKYGAKPQYVFVLKKEEITPSEMGGLRPSGVGGRAYFIEFSENPEYYKKRAWGKIELPNGKVKHLSPIEEKLHKSIKENRKSSIYIRRWKELKKYGLLK